VVTVKRVTAKEQLVVLITKVALTTKAVVLDTILTAMEEVVVIIRVALTSETPDLDTILTIHLWTPDLVATMSAILTAKEEVVVIIWEVQYLERAQILQHPVFGKAPPLFVMHIAHRNFFKIRRSSSLKSPIPIAEAANIAFQEEKSCVAPTFSTISTIVVTGVGTRPFVAIRIAGTHTFQSYHPSVAMAMFVFLDRNGIVA